MKKLDTMIVRLASAALAVCVAGCAGGTAATPPALPDAPPASSTAPSKATSAEILVTNYESGEPATVVEFAKGVRGNASPLRRFAATASAFGLRTDGSYWSGPYYAGRNPYDPGWVELRSPNGTIERTIHGVQNEPMHEVTADRDGDVLVSDWMAAPSGDECNVDEGHLRWYSAAESFKMTREIDARANGCTDLIYVGSKGTIYIGYNQYDSAYSTDSTGIVQLARNATTVDQYVRVIGFEFPYVTIEGLGTDARGNLFALVNNELLEYAPGKTKAKFVLKGVPVTSLALDSHDDLYVVVGNYIEEFSPGTTRPFRVIGGPATGLTNPGRISVSD
jgi:hypothetical protein